jgi:hypothetical protein
MNLRDAKVEAVTNVWFCANETPEISAAHTKTPAPARLSAKRIFFSSLDFTPPQAVWPEALRGGNYRDAAEQTARTNGLGPIERRKVPEFSFKKSCKTFLGGGFRHKFQRAVGVRSSKEFLIGPQFAGPNLR